MNQLLALPLLIPLASAVLSLLAWNHVRAQRWLAVGGTAILLAAAVGLLAALWGGQGMAATQIGDWPAPFGITLIADLFSAVMLVLAGMIGLAVAIYSLADIDERREAFGYYAFLHILLMGICGALLAGDIFNLYVWFEVMLIASFVLLALGGERRQLQGAVVYVALNLLASATFLAAIGLLYGMAGTLNMADLARKFADRAVEPGLVTLVSMLFLVAFGIKAALFPLFFWLPASYHTPPVAVSAIFAGLLTKVAVYALIRVFTLLFVAEQGYTHGLILILAGFTMLTGVLGAVAQNEFRRLLSFHIISQIGYMIMGLGLFGLASSPGVGIYALAGSIYFIAHNIFAKTNLFLLSGVVRRIGGSFHLKRLGGLYGSHPVVSLLFLIPALSLAGIPPLSGFFGKLALARAGLEAEQYAIVATALVVSFLTLFSMTKIWMEVFWKAAPKSVAQRIEEQPEPYAARGIRGLLLPISGLAAVTVAMGLAAEPFFQLALRAAEQLANPEIYMQAVLGEAP